MRTVTLTIEGDYWDLYLYAGRLYLFTCDGALEVVDIASLVDAVTGRSSSPLNGAALTNTNDYLDLRRTGVPGPSTSPTYDCPAADIRRHIVASHDAPVGFPHTALRVYNFDFYVGSSDGLRCFPRSADPDATSAFEQPRQLWDGPSFDIDTRLGSVAIAAGEEGMYEMTAVSSMDEIDHPDRQHAPSKTADLNCSQVGYLYSSPYATSIVDDGELVPYRIVERNSHRTRTPWDNDIEESRNEFVNSFSFPKYNRIGDFSEGDAGFFRYFEEEKNPEKPAIGSRGDLPTITSVRPGMRSNRVVRGGVSSFGFLVEVAEALIVILKDTPVVHPAPARWRVFPALGVITGFWLLWRKNVSGWCLTLKPPFRAFGRTLGHQFQEGGWNSPWRGQPPYSRPPKSCRCHLRV